MSIGLAGVPNKMCKRMVPTPEASSTKYNTLSLIYCQNNWSCFPLPTHAYTTCVRKYHTTQGRKIEKYLYQAQSLCHLIHASQWKAYGFNDLYDLKLSQNYIKIQTTCQDYDVSQTCEFKIQGQHSYKIIFFP